MKAAGDIGSGGTLVYQHGAASAYTDRARAGSDRHAAAAATQPATRAEGDDQR